MNITLIKKMKILLEHRNVLVKSFTSLYDYIISVFKGLSSSEVNKKEDMFSTFCNRNLTSNN